MFNILDEERDFYTNIVEQIEKVLKNGKIVLTKFLTLREQEIIRQYISNKDINILFDGGYVNAERKRCLLFPYTLDLKPQLNINCFKILYNKRYLKISHQNVLGTLMSLKIDRSLFGDIVFVDDACYFYVSSDIEPILLLEFNMINKVPITLERVEQRLEVIPKYDTKQVIVSSMRIDNIISRVYHQSRNQTKQLIESGFVYKNYQPITNPADKCEIDDVIAVRKKGKFIISQFIRTTKSNKNVLKIDIPTS